MFVQVFLSPCTKGGQYTCPLLLLLTYDVKVKTLLLEIQEWYFHTMFRKGVAGHVPRPLPFGGTCVLDLFSLKVK